MSHPNVQPTSIRRHTTHIC